MTRGRTALTTILLAIGIPAPAPAAQRATATPTTAIPGAVITVAAGPLASEAAKVTIGGRPARVVAVRSRGRLRVEVPVLSPGARPIVVRRGAKAARGRLTIAPRFTGSVGAVPDARRAVRRTIGPKGGTIVAPAAGGTRFVLAIPRGALKKATRITVTPARRFRTLPFSGGARAGVVLAPSGLVFARPATLTVTTRRPFGRATAAFSASKGRPFEVVAPLAKGRTTRARVNHFSDAGVGAVDPADFARVAQPIVDGRDTLDTPAEIDALLDLIAVFETFFTNGEDDGFCKQQPLCAQAIAKAEEAREKLVTAACRDGVAQPTPAALVTVIALEAERQRTGSTAQLDADCVDNIARPLFAAAKNANAFNPLGTFFSPASLAPAFVRDLDADGIITTFEWLLALGTQVQLLGVAGASNEASGLLQDSLERIRTDATAKCDLDRAGAEKAFRAGLAYANQLGGQVEAFQNAQDACLLTLVVAPAIASLEPGDPQQFTATAQNVSDPVRNGEVTWSTSGGTITADGLYTAPQEPGAYEVRAVSKLNPKRQATGTASVGAARCVPPARRRTAGVIRQGDVTADTQAEVDALAGVTEITGTLLILGPDPATSDITSLAPLRDLTKVGGSLNLQGLSKLTSLEGLEALNSVGDLFVIDDDALTTLAPLCGITTARRVSIDRNESLKQLGPPLATVEEELFVTGNPQLATLGGLDGLTSVGGLTVGSTGLTSLAGLDNLTTVKGDVGIFNATERAAKLTTFRLPKLKTAGTVSVRGSTGPLTRVELPELTTGGLGVSGRSVPTIDLPKLATLSVLSASDLTGSVSVKLAQGAKVTGDVLITSNRAAVTLTTTPIASVGGKGLVIFNEGVRLRVPIGSIAGDLTIGRCTFGFFATDDSNVFTLATDLGPPPSSVGGNVLVQGNVGFSDAQANGTLQNTAIGGTKTINFNKTSGQRGCS